MSDQATLLVADDDEAVRLSLERTLTREGYSVVLAPDGPAALDRLRQGGIDLLLSDLKMPGLTGLELLKLAKEVSPDVDVILLTAFGTVEEAVRAMKDGAIDFLTKPLQRAQLLRVVRQALERRSLIQQNRALQRRLDDLLRQGNMIGVSPAFKQMMTLIRQVADSSATVLIQGESGTGKELVARAIHDGSPRHAGPFVAVNCAALPETLLESELFGYEKGAFTGAAGRKEGRFELADGGTLFLDEVADLSPLTQPKILRVLQEGEFERVGGTRTLRVDVRIVTATNQDLAQLVRDKRFREDLYYRLNVITVTTPPLRDRREDIRVLAQHFLRVYAAKNNRTLEGLSDEALGCLEAYRWPGNVRELENVVERAVVLARGTVIEVDNLPRNVTERPVTFTREAPVPGQPVAPGAAPDGVFTIRIGTPLAEIEQRVLEETLRFAKGNRTVTAKLLGVDPKTVFRKLKQVEGGADEPSDKPPEV
ncbi:MAG: sigma-54-dependent Fis family transcriptional regulator [Candidatus Rokubacteria bacterium]|nr:sigma-54-dependent Fis family transcriptional regulator [Candidatus Rokubacteria bacterium]